jgi:hypothetical protein
MGFFDWLFKRKEKPQAAIGGFTTIKGPDGRVMMVDPVMLEYMQSTAPQPTQSSLDEALKTAARIVIHRGGAHGDSLIQPTKLVETNEPTEITALQEALQIVDGGHGHCMCHGDLAIEVFSRNNQRIAILGVHHGISIRWKQWKDDAQLKDGQKLLAWIASKGSPEPLEQFMEMKRQEEEQRRTLERWKAAMPICMRLSPEVWQQAIKRNDLSPFQTALAEAYPNASERAKALFRWYGSGAGSWSGCPAYEQFAELLLQNLPQAALEEGAQSAMEDSELEGAARYFAEHEMRSQSNTQSTLEDTLVRGMGMAVFKPHAKTPAPIPKELKRKLSEHSATKGLETNREGAQAAFSDS